ncbi:MAG: M20/M25/M40 family metallo-hydrolase [Proteobacteria bacterium]|nr:M20/M25/M40 family metallo-hydrolase [Pseudomonadota bacterium]
MSRFNRTLAALAAALACVATAEAAQAASPTWITLDDDAYALLRGLDAGTTPSASRTLVMSAPGGLRDVLSVHAVAVDAAVLPRLSQAVHDSLHHCGGYMVHASLAEAKEALSRIDAAPAAAPSYAIDNQATVNDLLPHIDEGKVLASIQRLSDYRNRYYASSTGVAASDWLAQAWALLGRNRSDVSVRQVTHAWPQKSVVLTIRGTTAPDEIVVIGGHLDSIAGGKLAKAPGADDDASGIASLAEVARTLIQSGYQPKRTIEFMAYAAEEEGLLGSADIARDYATQGRNVVGVLQLDMTNYMGSIDDIYVITDFTNAAQNAFLHDLASAYLPTLAIGETRCGYACSDHASWNSRGYIASFPFESGFGEDNPYIHTKEDTLDKSGNVATHAAKFSRLALAYAVELGSD